MSSELARKFRFVSPGIFLREVDNSQLPRLPDAVGPTIIGRYSYGPAMRPFKVNSLAEFVEVYGNPIPGASSGDVWREGNKTGPTYAAYAAFAWLNSGVAPANIVRLLGDEHDQNDGTVLAQAGWTTTDPSSTGTARSPDAYGSAEATNLDQNGGAYGLWIIPSGSDLNNAKGTTLGTGSLAAIWYMRKGAVILRGKQVSHRLQSELTEVTGAAVMIHSEDSNYTFQAEILDTTAPHSKLYTTKFNFDRNSENYIRKVFNTDPILTNRSIVDSTTVTEGRGNYFLGETFESNLFNVLGASTDSYGMILPISSGSGMTDGSGSISVGYEDHLEGFKNPQTGWFFSQDLGTTPAHYAAERMTKLFKFHGLDGGEWLQNNIKISIADIRAPTSLANPYGTFTIQIRRASDSDNVPVILEQFTECDLNPASSNFVAAKVGDMFMEFDYNTNRLREYGQYRNQSSFVRIEMNPSVENGTADPELLPFGVFGPVRPTSWRVRSNDGDDDPARTTVVLRTDITPEAGVSARATLADTSRGGSFIALGSDTAGNVAAHFDPAGTTAIAFGEDPNSTRANGSGQAKATNSYTNATYRYTASYEFPKTLIRVSASAGNIGDPKDAYFGLQTGKSLTDITFDPGYPDYLRRLPTGFGQVDTINGPPADREYSWTFSLDDLRTVNFSAAASATFTFTDKTNEETTITLTDFEGTSITFEVDQAGDGLAVAGSGNTLLTGFANSAVGIATGLTNFVNASVLKITAVRDGAKVTLTQDSAGSRGNTQIVLSDTTNWLANTDPDVPSAFTGGTDTLEKTAHFASGSRRRVESLTALSASNGGYKVILDEGFDRFTSPLYGGFDGFDIYEAEPLRNSAISATDNQFSNYAFNTVKRAIDTVADPEFVETNLMVVPGVTNKNLTKLLLDTAEARADALAIIDIEDVYTPFTENTQSYKDRVGSVNTAITSLRNRDLDTSYGATYYPWVQIRDPNTSKLVWVPPSVAALGTFGSSEAKSELWFAPAGFTRGGLSDGAAGLPVVNITERVVRKDRDKLYTAKINPIAQFPAEGIVIFGQKTLQITPSALDRINVRRLLIFLKKEVSRFAATILFDQNVQATWTRFVNKVDPFLASVQTRLGLTDYKIVLDDTTTTADLIDRNILYAKIFLKPARAIEYIAIDFVITRTGASFDD